MPRRARPQLRLRSRDGRGTLVISFNAPKGSAPAETRRLAQLSIRSLTCFNAPKGSAPAETLDHPQPIFYRDNPLRAKIHTVFLTSRTRRFYFENRWSFGEIGHLQASFQAPLRAIADRHVAISAFAGRMGFLSSAAELFRLLY